MGVAYFVVLDNKEPGFETFVNGKAIARASHSIRAICDKLGIKSLDDLTSFGRLDAEFNVPEEYREEATPWFEPNEGIEWVSVLCEYIEGTPRQCTIRTGSSPISTSTRRYSGRRRRSARSGTWNSTSDRRQRRIRQPTRLKTP